MDYSALWTELTTDPEGLGYADPTDQANDLTNVGLLNDDTQTVERTSLTNAELWEGTDLTEYKALTAAGRQAYAVLVSLQTIDATAGSNSRAALAALFPDQSTTRANLIALVAETTLGSRANILGFGQINTQDIVTARGRYG